MNSSKLKTYWIIFLSCMATVRGSLKCVFKQIRGTSSRPWVDQTIHQWVDTLLRLAQIRCIVVNPHQVEPQPQTATIIMCNHTSMYDIPLSFKAFPDQSIRMLAKKELASVPFLGRGMKAAEFVFIDRKNHLQAFQDLAAARQLMESGIVLWIAPEGTRTENGKLGPFKRGAFTTAINAKATIIPIGITGAYEILPKDSMRIKMNQTAKIHVGKPIDASAYTLEQRQALIDKVHAEMALLLASS